MAERKQVPSISVSSPTSSVGDQKRCKCFPAGQSNKGRNLVVCIDGTSNQFGEKNTNVIELYSQIREGPNQLTYYNSGIGTYAKPSRRSLSHWKQVIDNKIDLAIAWNFEKTILGAYRWLADNYQTDDRIFLFGFSRGAYQVRTLAGMLHKVGLIRRGNEQQIPFAYELYADPNSDKVWTHKSRQEASTLRMLLPFGPMGRKANEEMDTYNLAERFKDTFSRSVQVHFVGVWDTVSSIDIRRGKIMPLTDSCKHICYFRHALALDERRVKFLPEYARGGVSLSVTSSGDAAARSPREKAYNSPDLEPTPSPDGDLISLKEGQNRLPHVKEVWFPGTHSDIGGGNVPNYQLDLGNPALLWMSYEAVSCGLQLNPAKVQWNWNKLDNVKESLTGFWHLFEVLLIKRLSYEGRASHAYSPHLGRGRIIVPGQKVHASVAFCSPGYIPKAILPKDDQGQKVWNDLVGQGNKYDFSWAEPWGDLLEMDIFDDSAAEMIISHLERPLEDNKEVKIWLHRLNVMAWTARGLNLLRKLDGPRRLIDPLVRLLTDQDEDIYLSTLESLRSFLVLGAKAICKDVVSPECKIIPYLRELLHHPEWEVQFSALKSIGLLAQYDEMREMILQTDIVTSLPSLLDDRDWEVRSLSFETINVFAEYDNTRGKLLDADTDVFGHLQNLLRNKSRDSKIQSQCLKTIEILVQHDNARSILLRHDDIEFLLEIVQDEDETKQQSGFEILIVLAKYDDARSKLLEAGIVDIMRKWIQSEDHYVRSSWFRVVGALAQYDDVRSKFTEADIIPSADVTGSNAKVLRDSAVYIKAQRAS